MSGQAERDDQDGIKPDLVIAKGGMAIEPVVGGAGDAPSLVRRERGLGVREGLPPLDLDEGEPMTAGGHDIDLAEGRAVAASENTIAFGQQDGRGQQLGGKAAAQAGAALICPGLN